MPLYNVTISALVNITIEAPNEGDAAIAAEDLLEKTLEGFDLDEMSSKIEEIEE